MPTFWQFPTVSMGLGPLMAIYQARFLKYLHARGIADTENRKVWVFCGDGEMDEPESLGAIGLASREKLDNLIFVINCNLQRLDGRCAATARSSRSSRASSAAPAGTSSSCSGAATGTRCWRATRTASCAR
jgi:pyruvate dehydrogenase E1 component